MFSRHRKSTNQLFKRFRDVKCTSRTLLEMILYAKMNYYHNNLFIFSRFLPPLSLTLVSHQCAEMEVSRELIGPFHGAGHTLPFNNSIPVIWTIFIPIKPENRENISHFACISFYNICASFFPFHLILSTSGPSFDVKSISFCRRLHSKKTTTAYIYQTFWPVDVTARKQV